MRPLSDVEINYLLSATLHGPLPVQMTQRVFATLAKHVRLRAKLRELLHGETIKHWLEPGYMRHELESLLGDESEGA